MASKRLIDKFKEIVPFVDDGFDFKEDEGVNRVQKEAYVCKRMKISRSQLIELCYCTGVDTLYEELRKKGGKK